MDSLSFKVTQYWKKMNNKYEKYHLFNELAHFVIKQFPSLKIVIWDAILSRIPNFGVMWFPGRLASPTITLYSISPSCCMHQNHFPLKESTFKMKGSSSSSIVLIIFCVTAIFTLRQSHVPTSSLNSAEVDEAAGISVIWDVNTFFCVFVGLLNLVVVDRSMRLL
jgi:hypothetical protein